MRCQSISGRVQSGLTSTNSCTVACDAKFSMSVTLGHVLEQQVVQPFCKDQPGGIAEPAQIRKAVTDHGIGGVA